MVQELIFIAYRDVEDFPRQRFELIPGPGGMVITPMVISGAGGRPDTHIRVRVGMSGDASTVINLITYTEYKLTEAEVSNLMRRAFEFASGRN